MEPRACSLELSLLQLLEENLLQCSGYSIATEITGPTTVNGLEWGSLTVQCAYGSGWETYLKWWCRGADWNGCNILVRTNGSEQEVKKNRVSIRDNQKNRIFTVTMENLKRDDADSYWCGIEKTGIDLGVNVQVTIKPDTQTPVLEWTTATASLAFTPAATQKTSSPLTRSLLSSTHFLFLLLLELPLLLGMLGAVLWVNRPQRRS
uniref:CD300 molecule like family member d n=1 Tax=Macaca mulatta TaxID=9544 RepID=A0A5F8ASS4_MACMU